MKPATTMRRRRRVATAAATAAAVGPRGKMSNALKQHNPLELKHWFRKSARSKRCRKALEVVTKSDERTTNDFLPFHVMADHILSRLPVKSLARFRSVCKQWCSLTHDPCFAKGQLERASETESFTFMSTSSRHSNKFWIYNFINLNNGGKTIKGRTFTLKFGMSCSHILSNSINGLVCAVYEEGPEWERERNCALLNPTTHEVLMLPKPSDALDLCNITRGPLALGFDASSGEYKLVWARNIYLRMNDNSRNYEFVSSCVFKVLTVGTQEWRYIGETPHRIRTAEVVYLNGALHWLTENPEPAPPCPIILVFDVKDEKLRFISVPKFKPYTDNIILHLYLRKLEGHICIVKRPRNLQRIRTKPSPSLEIWKLEDYANDRWKLEYYVDISGLKDPYDARVVDIVCGKVLVRNHGSLYSNDICHRTWHKLIDLRDDSKDKGRLHVLTESLISPGNLPVL